MTAPGNLKFAAPELPADAAELARLRSPARRPAGVARGQHAPGRGGDRRRGARRAGAGASGPRHHHRAPPSRARRRARRRARPGPAACRGARSAKTRRRRAASGSATRMGELGLYCRLARRGVRGQEPGGGRRTEPAGAGPARPRRWRSGRTPPISATRSPRWRRRGR